MQNIFILVPGYDNPSVECVIQNRATANITTHIQMLGRGARPYVSPEGVVKNYFTILDMGRNYARHGCYGNDIDWRDLFLNDNLENEPREVKSSTLRECGNCGSVMQREDTLCKVCDYENKALPTQEELPPVKTLTEIKSAEREAKLAKLPEHLRHRPFGRMSKSELFEYARIMEYKPGWVYHQLNPRKNW